MVTIISLYLVKLGSLGSTKMILPEIRASGPRKTANCNDIHTNLKALFFTKGFFSLKPWKTTGWHAAWTAHTALATHVLKGSHHALHATFATHFTHHFTHHFLLLEQTVQILHL